MSLSMSRYHKLFYHSFSHSFPVQQPFPKRCWFSVFSLITVVASTVHLLISHISHTGIHWFQLPGTEFLKVFQSLCLQVGWHHHVCFVEGNHIFVKQSWITGDCGVLGVWSPECTSSYQPMSSSHSTTSHKAGCKCE